jgi:hypothetical protein
MPAARIRPWHALLIAVLFLACVESAQNLPVSGEAQSSGELPVQETLQYNIEWRLIDAGKAKLSWNSSPTAGRAGGQVDLHLESAGLVSKLYKVVDDYRVTLGADLCAIDQHISVREGSRQRDTLVHFDAQAKKISYLEQDLVKKAVALAKEIPDTPPCVHDVVGGLYFIRTRNLEPGHSITVPVSDGKKLVFAKIEAQRREEVRVPAGTFKTVRYEAYLFNDVLYRRSGHMYVWLTDDRRKLPVRIQVKLHFTIGTITFQLEKQQRT